MILTVWPYLAVMLLAAGLFPSLEQRFRWRVFSFLPPIVWTYLLVTTLAVGGLWTPTSDIQMAQSNTTTHLLPALLFLLMVNCDLRAIIALGPRVLAVFASTMASILVAILVAYLLFRGVLPADGWKMLAALSATWTGGSANLLAVKESIGLESSSLPPVLLADALCYSLWVVILFSTGALAPIVNRWTRAQSRPYPQVSGPATAQGAQPGAILVWLGVALYVSVGAAQIAQWMPVSTMLNAKSWTVLIATVAGLVVARTPLARIPGPTSIASALLALLVAVLASQSNFQGITSAPLFVLCGLCTLAIHILLLALAARAFRFDMHLCGVSSLAQIGGVGTAPVLAATYSAVLVPIAVLLAMLGLVLGTGIGLMMAKVLSSFAPVV